MIDIFFKSSPVSVEGRAVPKCWTRTVDEVIEVLPEWNGFHEPAKIGTAVDGDTVYHLIGTTQQADLLDTDGALLGRDYYSFQAIHPLIASRCCEAEYDINGETGRCKLCDLPAGARVNAVRAPSKYLGVDSPTVPDPPAESLFPTQVLEISQADIGIMEMKEAVKVPAIGWIKQNPDGDVYDLLAYIGAVYDEPHAGAGQALLAVYIRNSMRAGLIQEATWEAFRDFIVSTPVEMLEAF